MYIPYWLTKTAYNRNILCEITYKYQPTIILIIVFAHSTRQVLSSLHTVSHVTLSIILWHSERLSNLLSLPTAKEGKVLGLQLYLALKLLHMPFLCRWWGSKGKENFCLTRVFPLLSVLQQVAGPVSVRDVILSMNCDKHNAAQHPWVDNEIGLTLVLTVKEDHLPCGCCGAPGDEGDLHPVSHALLPRAPHRLGCSSLPRTPRAVSHHGPEPASEEWEAGLSNVLVE